MSNTPQLLDPIGNGATDKGSNVDTDADVTKLSTISKQKNENNPGISKVF